MCTRCVSVCVCMIRFFLGSLLHIAHTLHWTESFAVQYTHCKLAGENWLWKCLPNFSPAQVQSSCLLKDVAFGLTSFSHLFYKISSWKNVRSLCNHTQNAWKFYKCLLNWVINRNLQNENHVFSEDVTTALRCTCIVCVCVYVFCAAFLHRKVIVKDT